MSIQTKRNPHFIPRFEARSVLLVEAMTCGSVVAVHAQSPAPAAQAVSKSSAQDQNAVFVRADINKDGKLDKKESETVPPPGDWLKR